jgi:predicted enzyme related to lactoylglutathione lyase
MPITIADRPRDGTDLVSHRIAVSVEQETMMAKRQERTRSILPGDMRAGRIQPERPRLFLSRGLLIACFGLAGAAPSLAAPFQLPQIVDPPTDEHHVGKVVFVELVTPDLAAAEHFYGALFGWTFHDIQAGSTAYAEASLDGRPVAGLLHKPMPAGQRLQPSWLSFIAVRDVDATEKTAVQNGAKVLREPHTVPDRGRQAVLADPQGAIFAVLASSSGDTPDVLAEPGDWIWSSLITTDPDADAAFYQKLFDYEVFELPAPDGTQHLTLATDNYARASANSLPANKPDIHPHWLNYVRVDDAVATTEKIVALGGHVLVAPRVDRQGGKVALVADPSGAPFGLLEWPDTESKEVTK